MYPAALMRAVDVGLAHSQLKSCWHTAGRTHDPVPAIAFVELWTFAGAVLCTVAVEHDNGLSDSTCTICRQLADRQHRCELATRVSPAVYQITTSVFVPKWSGVDIALSLNHADGIFPLAGRIAVLGLHHHHAEVRVAPVDVVLSVVVADAGGPHAIAVLRLTAKVAQQHLVACVEVLQRIAHYLPVHQVLGVQNGQSGCAVKARCRQVVVVAAGPYTHVGVGVVGINHGVGIGAITIVGAPYLRVVLCLCCQCQ